MANSRPHKKSPSIWRRRHCKKCGHIFTSYERPSLAENKKVQLPDGTSEGFNLGKLLISISSAFTHDKKNAQYSALWLAQTVEDTLSTQVSVVTPDEIASTAHQVLKSFDELAAVQYAAGHQLLTSLRQRGRPSFSERHARRSQQ